MKKYQVVVSQNRKDVEIIIRANSLSEMVRKTLSWCKENNFVMSEWEAGLPYYAEVTNGIK